MILGVNGIRLLGKRSGVGRMIEAFLLCLDEIDHPFREVRVYSPRPLPDDVSLPGCARSVVLPSVLPLGLWEQVVLPRAHPAEALLLCPSYVIPLFARSPTFLIHHGSYEGYPQAFGWFARNKARLINSLSARNATVVSTVSHHSKRDIAHYYGLDPNKIHVVPEGVDCKLFRVLDEPERLAKWCQSRLGSTRPFILYTGKPTRRRNLPNLVEAFGELRRRSDVPHRLVLVGMDLPGSPLTPVVERLGLQDHVQSIGFLPHEEIVLAYNAADLFVYPSSYEGFGMPVLEAMACGTPAIALNNTAFPEFAGGVACLLPDAEVSTLRDGMATLLGDPRRTTEMAAEGPKRAAAYDWRIVSHRYIELMRQAVGA